MNPLKSFHVVLALVILATFGVAAFLFFNDTDPKHKDFVTALPGMLAVVAAIVAAWPAVRMLDMQRDALRPSPTPYLDTTSRNQLLLLRVKNLGASVAYDVKIKWDAHPKNEEGEDMSTLDEIPVLLPQADPSILLGRTRELFQKYKPMQFSGGVEFKDATGRKISQRFRCSADEYRHSLIYDDDMSQTLCELQKVPKGLEEIVKAIKRGTDS